MAFVTVAGIPPDRCMICWRQYLVIHVTIQDRSRHMNSRSRWLLATGIFLVFILSACGNSDTTTTNTTANGTTTTITHLKIMVGGLSKQIYLPNMLTQQLGYFQQEGLDVTLIDEASGQSSENQVVAGHVDTGAGA